jgi:hypothetical protein
MPPSGFSKKATAGLVTFVGECFKDLKQEVESGKHPNLETAMAYELKQIEQGVRKIHLNENAELVERQIPDE